MIGTVNKNSRYLKLNKVNEEKSKPEVSEVKVADEKDKSEEVQTDIKIEVVEKVVEPIVPEKVDCDPIANPDFFEKGIEPYVSIFGEKCKVKPKKDKVMENIPYAKLPLTVLAESLISVVSEIKESNPRVHGEIEKIADAIYVKQKSISSLV